MLAFGDLGRPQLAKRINLDTVVVDQDLCELFRMADVMLDGLLRPTILTELREVSLQGDRV